MQRLFTPLLNRVYALFGAFVLVYFGVTAYQYSSWNKERLFHKLVVGPTTEKASAAFDLAYLGGEEQLVRALKSDSPAVRGLAVNSLWELWVRAGGHQAFRQLQAANQAIQRQSYPAALQILDRVVKRYPDFPEGWNRRATLYWQMGRFQDSVADAQKAVALNPNHFGAWQGMGLCEVHLGNLEEACRCLRAALRITPHDPGLRRFLNQCEELLHLALPAEYPSFDTV